MSMSKHLIFVNHLTNLNFNPYISTYAFKIDEDGELEFEKLNEILHTNGNSSNHSSEKCNLIAFAPKTSLVTSPKCVHIAAAYTNFVISIYKSDLADQTTVQILQGHTNYVNQIAWEPENAYLASVSDDHSCILWENGNIFEKKTTFYLKSAGIAVKWHPDREYKLLVAEKNGIIRYYNVKTEQAVLSIETKKTPLMSMDWAPSKCSLVAALAAGEFSLWNLDKPCIPLMSKQVHESGGMTVKFAPHNEEIVATIGGSNMTLKVFYFKSDILILETPLKLCGGLCWHSNLPILIAA